MRISIALLLKMPMKRITKLTSWLTIVAIAAPETPRSNVKISSGSSAILITAPETSPIIA